MKNLLERDFIAHYGLAARVTVNVVSTTNTNFDLKDDAVLIYSSGTGTAEYSNPSYKEVNVISYETFFKSLPQTFQNNRKNCDLIVYTSDKQYFLLNELTDTNPQYVPDFTLADGTPRIGKRNTAILQLEQTLQCISDVPEIDDFIKRYTIKHCCFFNKQTHAPAGIIAVVAFSRLSAIVPNGYKMSNPEIESYNFELWEFSGTQTYLLKDQCHPPVN
jgi:hypothetical protein